MSLVSAMPSLADYQQVWVRIAEEILSQVAVSKFTAAAEVATGAVPPLAQCATFSLGAPLEGRMALLVTPEDALQLSRLFLGEPADRAREWDSQHEEALSELFQQVGAKAADILTSTVGEKATVEFTGLAAPSWLPQAHTGFNVRLSGSSEAEMILHIRLSPELSAALGAEPPAVREAPVGVAPRAWRETNFEFLKDVEVGVSLRFGKTTRQLRDVMELMPGAVLELDQQVQEPVELLVGNRVIARGEVVVVDDSYGVRITDVVSKTERLESLYN